MDNERNRPSWWKWAITPPQSYAIYLAALVLVFVFSFHAGTLKPQKTTTVGAPPASTPAAPRN